MCEYSHYYETPQIITNIEGITMHALQQLLEVEKEARAFGFEWPNQEMIIAQIVDECREIKEDIQANATSEKIQEEIGDVLHAAISLCVFSGYDLEKTFAVTHKKFAARMQAMKILTRENGLTSLHGQTIEFMLTLWDKAKLMASEVG
jgi:uncharacterized protein YabN with tetrapyrrole methylase and pyrophosphatase domain